MQNFTVSEHEKLNTAVALGFFDGLHKGHRRVILSAVEQKKNGLLPVCFTFAQSPKEVLQRTLSRKLFSATSTQNLLSAVLTIISEKTEKAIPICSKSFVMKMARSLK